MSSTSQSTLEKIRAAIPEVKRQFSTSTRSLYHSAALMVVVYACYHASYGNLNVALRRTLQKMQDCEKSHALPPMLKEQPGEWEGIKCAIALALGTDINNT